jgi:hypothetical protein
MGRPALPRVCRLGQSLIPNSAAKFRLYSSLFDLPATISAWKVVGSRCGAKLNYVACQEYSIADRILIKAERLRDASSVAFCKILAIFERPARWHWHGKVGYPTNFAELDVSRFGWQCEGCHKDNQRKCEQFHSGVSPF